MKVLGLDPSVKSTGYGIIDYSDDRYSVVVYGCISPKASMPFYCKMNEIRIKVEELIHTYQPDEVAIENPFYAQNIKTAITLGQVRGATLVAIASCELPLSEYSPLEIKKAVTGYGRADKYQVITMVKALLQIQDESLNSDAADALATAFCHINTRTSPLS
ncbi:MAG: crossover junction endodeoxyribonuclease RuvC [Candidatus Aminicenantes bacterium]|nr:crossover junction endodeoxyribonuclease RuvC [Candidatus Aminicenantes bacterium]